MGKGLIAISGAPAIPAFVLLLASLDAVGLPRSDTKQTRSDRKEA